jgi:uroporphyrinogen-III synthase
MSKPVLLIRAKGNEDDAKALAKLGISSLIDPYLQLTVADNAAEAEVLLSLLTSSPAPLWLIATSTHSINYWGELVGESRLRESLLSRADLKFAAIGNRTADTLRQHGAKEILMPREGTALELGKKLTSENPPGHVLIPGGNLAMQNLPRTLVQSGWQVSTAVVYMTKPVIHPPHSIQLLRNQKIGAILFRSPSAVRALTHFLPSPKIPLVCAGETTARAVEAEGLTVTAIASTPTPSAIAVTLRDLLER